METLHGWVVIGEAADRLGVSKARVHQLVRAGALPASQPSRDLLISVAAIDEYLHLRPPPGRPISQSAAWKEIESVDLRSMASREELDLWRRRMRSRAAWRRYRIHPAGLRRIRDHRGVVLSGRDAAAFWLHPTDPDPERIIGYVLESDLPAIEGEFRLRREPIVWNIELGVVTDEHWRFGRILHHVSERVAWLDLADHRDRAEDVALTMLMSRRPNEERLTEFRQDLIDRGSVTIEELADRRSEPLPETETLAEEWLADHRLIVVEHDGRRLIPACLLTAEHEPDGFWESTIAALSETGATAWNIWAWIDSPTGWLSGEIPSEVARSDPERVEQALALKLRSQAD